MFAEIIAAQAFRTFNLGSISVFERRNSFVSFLGAQEASGTYSVELWWVWTKADLLTWFSMIWMSCRAVAE